MEKQDGQIAHGAILTSPPIQEMLSSLVIRHVQGP
jgi:hypothetical protein